MSEKSQTFCGAILACFCVPVSGVLADGIGYWEAFSSYWMAIWMIAIIWFIFWRRGWL